MDPGILWKSIRRQNDLPKKSAARNFECGSRAGTCVNKSVYTCYPYRGLSMDVQIVPVNVNGSVDCHSIQLPAFLTIM